MIGKRTVLPKLFFCKYHDGMVSLRCESSYAWQYYLQEQPVYYTYNIDKVFHPCVFSYDTQDHICMHIAYCNYHIDMTSLQCVSACVF